MSARGGGAAAAARGQTPVPVRGAGEVPRGAGRGVTSYDVTVSPQVPRVTAAWRCVHVPTQDCRHVPVRVSVDVPEEKCRQVREQFVKTRVPSSC